ncbi:MAG: helix-hairpin-helix domain-containing protein [Anaerolineae bacterium]|jgi:competence ComEA-like helix-hairpin-helix protein
MTEQRINVNTATAEELTQLPGIGPVLAERIVTYRDTVGFFEEPAQITAVSGIGERTYHTVADRLAVAGPEELARPAVEAPQEEMEKAPAEPAAEDETPSEAEALYDEQITPEVEVEPEVRAVPAGEPMLEEELTLPEEAAEEVAVEAPPQTDHPPEEPAEEAPPEIGDVPEEMIEGALPEAGDAPEEIAEAAPPEVQELLAEEEAAPEVEEEPGEEPSDVEAIPVETRLPPVDVEERPEPAPSRSWWRRLSWLWTALLGGLLGMAFALVVFSGVNGSLDVGHSRAVVDVRGRMDTLATDINSLQGDVDGLRKRLDDLEELTVRMDRIEAAVGDLQEASKDLADRADALDQRIDTVVAELEDISERVTTLQDQAEQTRSFFRGLQTLLSDVFGEVEGESMVTPTPTTEGK